MIHRRTHPVEVPGCEKCKWMSVGIAAAAIPSRKPGPVQIDRTQARWDADMPAYKRLRRNGLQPPSVDGCANLEKDATTAAEVNMGKVIPFKDLRDSVNTGMEASKELGYIGG